MVPEGETVTISMYQKFGTDAKDKVPNVIDNSLESAVAKLDYRAWMTGTFDTGGGVLNLSPAGGTYEYSNGRMSNIRIEGPIMEGRWEQDSSAGKCPDGRYHGRFRLTFSENGFTGLFGYCDEEPARRGGFQGTRRKP